MILISLPLIYCPLPQKSQSLKKLLSPKSCVLVVKKSNLQKAIKDDKITTSVRTATATAYLETRSPTSRATGQNISSCSGSVHCRTFRHRMHEFVLVTAGVGVTVLEKGRTRRDNGMKGLKDGVGWQRRVGMNKDRGMKGKGRTVRVKSCLHFIDWISR
jgi:hypothetical protein